MKNKNIDISYWDKGIHILCGVDEAGRGPLAGPVVAGAVVLPPYSNLMYVDDSKKLTPNQREKAFNEIFENALSIGVGWVEPFLIDEWNILNATKEAMRKAIGRLNIVPENVLIDYIQLTGIDVPQEGILHGDRLSLSIASASVVAKVIRDRIMEIYDVIYPVYGFSKHKGYGTKYHIQQIEKYGPSKIHRKSFKPISKLIGFNR